MFFGTSKFALPYLTKGFKSIVISYESYLLLKIIVEHKKVFFEFIFDFFFSDFLGIKSLFHLIGQDSDWSEWLSGHGK